MSPDSLYPEEFIAKQGKKKKQAIRDVVCRLLFDVDISPQRRQTNRASTPGVTDMYCKHEEKDDEHHFFFMSATRPIWSCDKAVGVILLSTQTLFASGLSQVPAAALLSLCGLPTLCTYRCSLKWRQQQRTIDQQAAATSSHLT